MENVRTEDILKESVIHSMETKKKDKRINATKKRRDDFFNKEVEEFMKKEKAKRNKSRVKTNAKSKPKKKSVVKDRDLISNSRDKETDVAGIHEGQIFQNYRWLCIALNESEKSGSSKISQVDRWQRYFSFERDKNKYIITKIYDDDEKNINLKPRSKMSEQTTALESALLSLLAIQEEPYVIITRQELYYLLGLHNRSFIEISNDDAFIPQFIGDVPSDILVVKDFFSKARRKFERNTNDVFNKLQKDGIITDWSFKFRLFRDSDVPDTKAYEQIATKDESDTIDRIINESLASFKAKRLFEIYSTNREKTFWSVTNRKIHAALNCYKHTKVYVVNFDKSKVIDYSIDADTTYFNAIKETNSKISEGIIKNALMATNRSDSNANWEALNNHIITEQDMRRYISGGYATAPNYVGITQKCVDAFITISNKPSLSDLEGVTTPDSDTNNNEDN